MRLMKKHISENKNTPVPVVFVNNISNSDQNLGSVSIDYEESVLYNILRK